VTARTIAMEIFRRVRADGAYADLALSAALERSALPHHEKALTTELVYGVLRNRAYLDWHLDRIASRPVAQLENRVADALRIGAYQLLFLDRIPTYAAVDESVQMVPKRATGFVNAILRRVPRGQAGMMTPVTADPLKAGSVRWSHPYWLLKMWADQFDVETALAVAEANQIPPNFVLRTNTLKTDPKALATELRKHKAQPTRYAPEGLIVQNVNNLMKGKAFVEGRFIVQGEASQIVGELVGVHPGEKVLDLCAAPGGKATHLAALVGKTGHVYAADLHPRRLRLLRGNVKRLGIENMSVMQIDATRAKDLGNHNGLFDRVLVDAPCSSLGTLAKNPEIRWRIQPEDPKRMSKLQKTICHNAATHVRPGGMLLYSVCTLTAAETTDVVKAFLRRHRDFVLDDLRKWYSPRYDDFLQEDGTFLSLPHVTGAEGFFAARFVRKEKS